jgi:DNA-binding NarL/FixJ family response regulator
VLHVLARGWCNQRIAAHLCLQEKTVRNTLSNIYEKLDLQDRMEAALYYWGRQDLLE